MIRVDRYEDDCDDRASPEEPGVRVRRIADTRFPDRSRLGRPREWVALVLFAGVCVALGCDVEHAERESESRVDASSVTGTTRREETAPWNVLMLVPDTVRSDHLSINGYFRETTPRIDALARDGINFRRVVTVAPRTWQSFSSILTGRFPPGHGVRHIYDEPLSRDIPTIATALSSHGYAVAAFDVMFALRGMTGGHGFDRYWMPRRVEGEHETDDEVLADQIYDWILGVEGQPYLAFVRFGGGHWPYVNGRWAHEYDPCDDCDHTFNTGAVGLKAEKKGRGMEVADAEAYRKQIWAVEDEKNRRHRIAHYDSELRAMDTVIGDLLDRLELAGRLDRTIIIVTSDHGESFGEKGYLQHGPRVDHTVMRVPLIIHLPAGHPLEQRGVVRDDMVRVVDLFPTLMHALDLPAPEGIDGHSLLDAGGSASDDTEWAYGEAGRSFMGTDPERHYPGVEGKQRMTRSGDWKLVWTPGPGGGVYRLYDLARDPHELEDVSVRHPQRVAQLRVCLDEMLAREGPTEEERDLSPDEIEQLKRLGYMQ